MKTVPLIALLQILFCLIQPALGGSHLRSLKQKPLTLHSKFVGTDVNVPGTTGAALTLYNEDDKKVGIVWLVATRFTVGDEALPPDDKFANANTFTFTFDNTVDTIVVDGVWNRANPNTLAITGGTGKYNGASGYMVESDNTALTVSSYKFYFK